MGIYKIGKLIEYIGDKNILLVSHIHPDGDAVGSVLGFYLFLKNKGFSVRAFLKDGVPYQYSFLKGAGFVERQLVFGKDDICLFLDASEFSRTGFKVPNIPIIRIDHHKTGEHYSAYDLVETSAPATSSLVLRILREWDEKNIDSDVARALYTGLLTDTVSFLHSNSFSWAFSDALYLSRKANIEDVGSMVYERKRKSFYFLLVRALERLTFDFNDKLAYTFIENKDFVETGAVFEDASGIVRQVISIDGVEVGVNFIEYESGVWKISARGKGKVDLATLCEKFGGGGHKNAAGCSIKGKFEDVVAKFKNELKRWVESL